MREYGFRRKGDLINLVVAIVISVLQWHQSHQVQQIQQQLGDIEVKQQRILKEINQ